MIEVKRMYKCFKDKEALKGVNINFKKGCIHGLIGVNGSGKTTLLKCITGVYKGDTGEVLINESAVYDNDSIKESLAYIEDENRFFYSYKVEEVIKFYEMTYPKFSRES